MSSVRSAIFGVLAIVVLSVVLPAALSDVIDSYTLKSQGVVTEARIVEVVSKSRTGKPLEALVALEPPLHGQRRLGISHIVGAAPGQVIRVVSTHDGNLVKSAADLDLVGSLLTMSLVLTAAAVFALLAIVNWRSWRRGRAWDS
jgi:ABC-type multidrug transport system fused ATPase/permease subunit